jgi:DNA invertase Pin-like site-specific DNA recombinase
MIIGYARVSTEQQSLNRQIDRLQEAHCERIFSDKVSGTKKDRPEFTMMMNTLREGDIIIVCELSRLSRKVKDIFAIVDKIHELGADIKSLKEDWLDTTTPTGKLLFTFIAGISQFERDMIHERTMEGLNAARKRGRLGGRPKIPKNDVEAALKMYDSKSFTLAEIEMRTGVKRPTLYLYLNRRKNGEL